MTHDITLPTSEIDPDREPHAASPTAHLLTELALYGHRPGADEPNPRPLLEPEGAQTQLNAAVEALSALLTGTRLEEISPTSCDPSSTCSTARSTASKPSSTATNRRRSAARPSRTAPRSSRSSSSA